MRRRLLILLAALTAVCLAWLLWPLPLPPSVESTRVLDRQGLLIAERPAPERASGAWVEAPPQVLVDAILSAEDHRFYGHPGVDPVGVARAFVANLRAGEVVQGGSTLTQQLVRTAWARPPGLWGKLVEAALALRLEAQNSKATLLAEYLNRVYLGPLTYGVDAAARQLFDKPATALALHEAALIAALPRRPADLDPWRFPSAARAARDRVLGRMLALGKIDAEAHQLAIAESLGLRADAPWGFAPHFVRRLGAEGGEVQATLDLALQREVERLVREAVARLAPRGVTQAAVLVIDTRSREVLAYVGSAGWQSAAGQVDGVMALRSPGSALKPFVYQLGLERTPKGGGITLATPLADLPGAWGTTHGTWSPGNYDGRFRGPVLARQALATSLNLPAVRVLEAVGVPAFHRRLLDYGLTTLHERPDHYGLGLVLGDGEVRLDELVNAYASLACGGELRPLRLLRGEAHAAPSYVGDRRAAWLILDALNDPDARAPAFRVDSVLEPAFDLAAKTGTSVGWRDNWAVAASPEVTVGVWVGNFDGAPMVDVSGITGAGPLLSAVVHAAHRGQRDRFRRQDFDPEGALRTARVCPLSGKELGPHCPGGRLERFLPGTGPGGVCDWHQVVEVDDGGALATGCPGAHEVLVVSWPARYSAWAADTDQLRWPAEDRSCVAAQDVQGIGTSAIASPTTGLSFWLDGDRPAEHQAIPLRAAAPVGTRQARWLVDEEEVATLGPPFAARWVPEAGQHRVALELDGVRVDEVEVWVGAAQ